ncbi:MAG: GvpL/GvpF family gas vesicle protein [Oscillochloris sp.]|nr:GvpL/GvpF family gas vesicle protein [Oscillochloris sp.]
MAQESAAEGKYLYGIMRLGTPFNLGSRSVGEQGVPIYQIVVDDLAALVSDSPIVEYEGSRRNLMAHTRVLEEAMQYGTVLPVRFGIVAPSEDAVRRQLSGARGDELRAALDQMEGRVELGLKAFWYEDVIFGEVVNENSQIRQLRDSLAGKSPEETYYERIRLGELIEGELARRRGEDAARIIERLRPLVEAVHEQPAITDRMVVNAAFLIRRAAEPEIDAAVNELDAELGKRMMFKLVGPAPLYNFVSLKIGWS